MLTFLGSGGAFNTNLGNTSAYFELGKELFLIDCGEDVFSKLINKGVLNKKSRVNIFITHLHSDHVGSLGTLIAYLYFKVFRQDMSNICVYFPSQSICDFLLLQGVSRKWYNFFENKWDELYIPGFHKLPEYSFIDCNHTDALNYNGTVNTFSLEFIVHNQFSFYYSGDTSQFDKRLHNYSLYDAIYHEVTSLTGTGVHMEYSMLIDETKNWPLEERKKIYLMHLDEQFDIEKALKDGFSIVVNETN